MEKKVLILEDNLQTAQVIADIVKENEREIIIRYASSVQEAYRISIEETLDVFIIDIILQTTKPGDTSGIKFAKAIREIEKYYFTPMLFITALADPELYTYRDLHCFGYIEKPFSRDQVKNILAGALRYETRRSVNPIIYFRKEGILYSVKLSEIIYIQVRYHKMDVVKRKEIIEIPYKTIKSFLQEIDSTEFVQCNRYTVLNRNYIEHIDLSNRYIKMIGRKELLEIGGSYRKEIRKFINDNRKN